MEVKVGKTYLDKLQRRWKILTDGCAAPYRFFGIQIDHEGNSIRVDSKGASDSSFWDEAGNSVLRLDSNLLLKEVRDARVVFIDFNKGGSIMGTSLIPGDNMIKFVEVIE